MICLPILFVIILLGMLNVINKILYPTTDITRNWHQFYSLEPNSVDTIILGSSHAYASFNTPYLREKTGKNVYILASNSQAVLQSYYNLKEILKYQTPECVILEAFSINDNSNFRISTDTPDKDWRKEGNIDGMRFGLAKIQAVLAQYYPSNWGYAFLPIIRTHHNWKNVVQIQDNLQETQKSFCDFRPSKTGMSKEVMDQYAGLEKNNEEYVISQENITAFHQMASFCRQKNIEFYVVMCPMYDKYIQSINYDSWNSKIEELCQQEQVPYLDCNYHYQEIGLCAQDFENIFIDYIHLNNNGADKVTNFVWEYWNFFS